MGHPTRERELKRKAAEVEAHMVKYRMEREAEAHSARVRGEQAQRSQELKVVRKRAAEMEKDRNAPPLSIGEAKPIIRKIVSEKLSKH